MQKEILKKDHVSNKKKEPKWPNIKNFSPTWTQPKRAIWPTSMLLIILKLKCKL